jgi:hypothetical protein
MYHDIRDDKDYPKRYNLKSFLNIYQFKNHLEYINKNYQVIKTSEIPEYIDDENGNYAILTFDDGLKDHYDIVDILLSNKNEGTFLIPTLPVTVGKMILSHKIQFIMAVEDEKKISQMILEKVGNSEDVYKQYSKSRVKDNWWSADMIFITNFLRYHQKGTEITNELFSKIVTNDEVGFSREFYLSENNIKEMVSSGMEIGGHGYTSNILTEENQEKEIKGSINFVSKFYNGDIMFSYPNGIYNDNTVKILRDNNCKYSFTTESTTIKVSHDNLRLPRFDAPQTILV